MKHHFDLAASREQARERGRKIVKWVSGQGARYEAGGTSREYPPEMIRLLQDIVKTIIEDKPQEIDLDDLKGLSFLNL